MIRVLSVLFTKVPPSFHLKSPSVINPYSSFLFKTLTSQQSANFTSLVPTASTPINTSQLISKHTKTWFLKSPNVLSDQIRTVIKYSLKYGKRKSVKAVRSRFFRLDWGIWIRTIAGRHKKLWKKTASQRNRLLNHVFCNSSQSIMLDKMVNKYWRKRKYYIDDPYEPYHNRENFYITRKKPWRPEGVDYE